MGDQDLGVRLLALLGPLLGAIIGAGSYSAEALTRRDLERCGPTGAARRVAARTVRSA